MDTITPIVVLFQELDLNEMARRVRLANDQWWRDIRTGLPVVRDKEELLGLVCTEISEAVEGERKTKPDSIKMDDKIPTLPMAEVEMADTLIRLLDYAGGFNLDLEHVTPIKMNPNSRIGSLFRVTKAVKVIGDFTDCPIVESVLVSRAICAVAEYCHYYGYDLINAYEEKMIFNRDRPDHKIEARLAPGGKEL